MQTASGRIVSAKYAIILATAVAALISGCNCGEEPPVDGGTGGGSASGGGAGGGAGGGGGGDVDAGIPTLSVNDVQLQEGDAGTSNLTFTVSLTPAAADAVTVAYATADGTATAGTDYATTSGTLSFAAGETSKTIDVAITGDLLNETDETFVVDLSNPSGAPVGDAQAVGTIVNDDPIPTLSVADVSAAEGTSGTAQLAFTVTLSEPSGQEVTVNFATSDGTATSADYTSASGMLTFAAGDVSKTVTVDLQPDAIDEDDETITLTLTTPVNATLADATATGTITDDDALPALSIDDVTAAEGNSGTSTFAFTVTLAPASGRDVTFNWATVDATATAGTDYTAGSGTVTIAAGQTTATINVTVAGDTDPESDETFDVTLTSPTNATLADATGVGTISHDDAVFPGISVSDPSVAEGAIGSTATLSFTVTLSAATTSTVTVSYQTVAGSAESAGAPSSGGDDFEPVSGTLTFAANDTSETVTVTVNGDDTYEIDEIVHLDVGNATNAFIADGRGDGTITNDDAVPEMSIADVSVTEGNSGTRTVGLSVSLTRTSEPAVSATFQTADGTATIADSDYVAATGTVTFAAGSTGEVINLTVNGDVADEPDETFEAVLTAPTNATLAAAGADSATVTINDDDDPPTLSVDDITILEAAAGTDTQGTFTVTLSAPSSQTVTASWVLGGGNAGPNQDYTFANGTVTFNPGQVSQPVVVTVLGDDLEETAETFNITLTGPTGATIADGTGVATIPANDSPTPTFSIDDATVAELSGANSTGTLTVTLSQAVNAATSVSYTTSNGTADAGEDYVAITTTQLDFAANQTSATIPITVIGDSLDELSETVNVTLSAASTGTTIGDGDGVLTITDDDAQPSLSINDISASEGAASSSGTIFNFTVTLSAVSGRQVTVQWATSNGTATGGTSSGSGVDYITADDTVTFMPGETTKTVSVTVLGDSLFEANETFNVDLSGAVGATITDTRGVATIENDDPAPTASIADSSVLEGDFGQQSMPFVITLSAAAGQSLTYNYSTGGGTATGGAAQLPGVDYITVTGGSVTFGPGETVKVVNISVAGDVTTESDETFNVTLTPVSPAAVSDGTGVGTIIDNDSP